MDIGTIFADVDLDFRARHFVVLKGLGIGVRQRWRKACGCNHRGN
jgi:hypothetical protein